MVNKPSLHWNNKKLIDIERVFFINFQKTKLMDCAISTEVRKYQGNIINIFHYY